ncbi:MAG: DUF2058 family protein [Deltaproteobacteria bacterium]|nr:MAG: DUF2058 family protein [Deltaproteobacteria bacterium]
MSLRDQLIKKGLVDKKRARTLDREAKRERKAKQSQREKKKVVERREQARREAELKAAAEARALARKEAELRREAAELPARVRQKIRANLIRARGPIPFHAVGPDGRTVHRLEVHERVAWKLRAGEAAIAALQWPERPPELVVISADAAGELRELDPSSICFLVTEVRGISAPELALPEPVEELDLRPRRATPDEVAAMRRVQGVRKASAGS